MDFKSWLFEAKTRKEYEKVIVNLLDLDPEEGINLKLNTLDSKDLLKKIQNSGSLKDISSEKKEKIYKMINRSNSGDSVADLISIMVENTILL